MMSSSTFFVRIVSEKCGRKVWAKSVGEKCGRKVWAKSVGEKCGRTLANKMASYTNLNFTIDQRKNTYFKHLHTKTYYMFLTLLNSVFTTVKLHRVTDIINHNALVKWRILTAQSLSVLNLQTHGL